MLLVFACGVLSAQGPGRQRSRRGGDTRMQQDSSEEWAKAQAELKKKYPEKYKRSKNFRQPICLPPWKKCVNSPPKPL